MIREILNPDLFHGHNKSQNYFEGWYFKVSDQRNKNTFAFIPGIFLGKEGKYSHSFIQVVDGRNIKFNYFKYSIESFIPPKQSLDIKVNKSRFSLNGIYLDIDEHQTKIEGKISFNNIIKWPDTIINPGSMGFYNYLTFMQCYSQVCALDINLTGYLNINGETFDFDNGKGYIEKNWGKEFPYSWIWIQGNQFKNRNIAISCSIGHIPFPLGSFRGFLIGLMLNGVFYSFTTMNKSRIRIRQKPENMEIDVENSNSILHMKVRTKKDKFMTLLGPRGGEMIPIANETLVGIIEVQLIDTKNNRVILKDITECAGVEYGGDQMIILDN